jgi:DNA-binding transcriptional regulator YhcF (GntR family)
MRPNGKAKSPLLNGELGARFTAASPARYRQVADRIRALITNGGIQPGEAVPTPRAVSKTLGVARDTVVRAYRKLEAEGLIKARPRDGFIVNHTRKQLEQRQRALKQRASALIADLEKEGYDWTEIANALTGALRG